MSRISCRLNRNSLALAMTSIATLGVLTACAGPSLPDTTPASSFKDGVGQVERGWDALVSVAGNLVLLFGLRLPWLGVPAVAAGIGYGVIRLVRARRP